jgi:hypothetical protein
MTMKSTLRGFDVDGVFASAVLPRRGFWTAIHANRIDRAMLFLFILGLFPFVCVINRFHRTKFAMNKTMILAGLWTGAGHKACAKWVLKKEELSAVTSFLDRGFLGSSDVSRKTFTSGRGGSQSN